MSLVLFNTKTRKKEVFKPLHDDKVLMYVCGVTPYDYSHIGHARCYVAFDLVYRYLQYTGYEVTYTRNYTDIDDKIIKRANEKDMDPIALAAEFIEAYKEDMAALNVLPANHEPKVSETIQEIIDMVQTIVNNGMGYEVDGDVYFAVEAMEDYGKLSGRNLEDLRCGARVGVDDRKRNPADFALWKSAKPGEPKWPSPWGEGRPGWHIECSAMSQKFLGDLFDIHGGGKDLVFPHHENEVAQSEACTGGKTHVNYWMHNGFVNVDNEKMSKSLDNFFTIREVLKLYHPETLRLFLMGTHYRSPINYSNVNLDEARKRLDYFYESIRKATEALGVKWDDVEPGSNGLYDEIFYSGPEDATLKAQFVEAMNDDFNAPKTLGVLSELFCHINGLTDGIGCTNTAFDHEVVQSFDDNQKLALLADALRYVKEFSGVLGIWHADPVEYLAQPQGEGAQEQAYTPEEIDALLIERAEARKSRDFARADEIRDILANAGIEVKDGANGTVWKYAS